MMLRVTWQVARASLRIAAVQQQAPIAQKLRPLISPSRMSIYNGNLMSRGIATGMAAEAPKIKEEPVTASKSTAKAQRSTKTTKKSTRMTAAQKEKAAIAKEQKKTRAAQRAAEAKAKAKAKAQAKHERLIARKKAAAEKKKEAREKAKDKAKVRLLKERERKKVEKERAGARAEKQRLAALRRPLVKRPKSTWQIFLQEFMSKRKVEHGPTSLPESARLAKAEFVALPQSELDRLQGLRDADKARYEQDVEKLLETRGVEGIMEENKRVRSLKKVRGSGRSFYVRLPGLPKRPGNAYGFFLKDASTLFPEAKSMPITERARFLGQRFRALSVDDRRVRSLSSAFCPM
ncbi:hypothetical protein POJ06DRAFT_259324 [Lipomyces tetrasporus]|uniref:HMG box domain-containing protein n=1 Tax=Lipomyces tetrasporus TaxID=54092 RepID=A0AAD7VRR0_9ASCO|nr:uncharacterized protein POJ06DRAFT_259324 [Lipomyces tetrasporus]KAJ8098380.1 hypothetical protein POJ06DRAFT_259324 [Lipomyces tetrasporus]